jgi:hypothetical protein
MEKFLSRVIAPLLLIAFTFVSCTSPYAGDYGSGGGGNGGSGGGGNGGGIPPEELEYIPIGQGTPVFAYLDTGYNVVESDNGITAMIVEDNEMAEGVLLLSEIPENDPANDNVVRVINKNNNSIVSFFYRSGEGFPYKMVITRDDDVVYGQFSEYNDVSETFSVAFQYEDELAEVNDLLLNKNVFGLYENQGGLTESQNYRQRNIITALALFTAMALQMPDSGFSVNARFAGFVSFLKNVVAPVLCVVAVVAVAIAVVAVPPVAVAVAGVGLAVSLTTATAIAAGVVAITAATAAAVFFMLPVNPPSTFGPGPQYNPPVVGTPPPETPDSPPAPVVEVDLSLFDHNGDPIPAINNAGFPAGNGAPINIVQNQFITVKLTINNPDLTPRVYPRILAYNSSGANWFSFGADNINLTNLQYFTFDEEPEPESPGGNIYQFAITKHEFGVTYSRELRLGIIFQESDERPRKVSINGNSSGLDPADFPEIEAEKRETLECLFMINFNLTESNAPPGGSVIIDRPPPHIVWPDYR